VYETDALPTEPRKLKPPGALDRHGQSQPSKHRRRTGNPEQGDREHEPTELRFHPAIRPEGPLDLISKAEATELIGARASETPSTDLVP
jgi:hypothetical protein